MAKQSLMMKFNITLILLVYAQRAWANLYTSDGSRKLDVLQHLGANSPWFRGPDVFRISPEVPIECSVDQAAYIVRHGSRYPDPGAYNEWTALYDKIREANFTSHAEISFLKSWKPVLSSPGQQIAQISPGGYGELYDLGVTLRTRYPHFYTYNTPFHLWANSYPRTIDSARLFARGYIGPNSSLADVHVIDSRARDAVGNSLATSDSCPTFRDRSGADFTAVWDDIYLPPITARLNKLIEGDLTLETSDVSLFPYLCGFESQITRRRSPWCGVFEDEEILQYEYRQDLRYWYGTGLGAGKNASVMLPVLQGVLDLFAQGPGISTHTNGNGTVELPSLIVAFTHDNQINELAAMTGVFDDQIAPQADRMDQERIFRSSHINPMRGTVSFEKLSCGNGTNVNYKIASNTSDTIEYIRVLLNDAVYPLPACNNGPGQSCLLERYADMVQEKFETFGSFAQVCALNESDVVKSEKGGVTFFRDLGLESMRVVKP